MPKTLQNLSPAKGSVRTNKRRGRGLGSGNGNTAGRGHKGAQSRSGYKNRTWFEGGQMPIHRRLPKRGFKNIFRQPYQIVNLEDLALRENLTEITPETLKEAGLIRDASEPVKLLGNGEITRALTVEVTAISKSAKEKVEKAGGSVTLPPEAPKRGKLKKKSERLSEQEA
ncbi:50S ribosomal protein L15 [bacterium]|nr:50S ribosomal protein L15 [bacterium]